MCSAQPAAPLRTVLTLAVAGLLLTGCSGSDRPHGVPAGTPSSSAGTGASPGAAPAAVTPLQPLPEAVPAQLNSYYTQQLSWQSCDQGFQCATFKVPVDYDHPGDGDLSLGAVRRPADGAGGAQRLGSLLLNPGGPGGSAVQYVEAAAGSYQAPVRAAYDLVGLDPRGVGRSSPITCLSGDRMDAYTAVDTSPDNQAEIDQLVAVDQEFAAGCRAHSGALLGHVSTVEAARDMDVLRALLGEAKLNYVGKSYGTLLGATYAGLFPSRVGRLVLDGAMDPSLTALGENRAQAGGFETAWDSFVRDCDTRDDCPLGRDEQQAGQQLDSLFGSLRSQALPGEGGRQLTESRAVTGVVEAMYAQSLWPQLRDALTAAKSGKGGPLLRLSDSYYERSADGSYPNLMFANMAVNCLDLPAAFASPADVSRAVPDFQQVSPHFGRDMAWMSLACAYWPIKATGAPHTVKAAGAGPIVVVGTTRDPATPYAWAQSLAGQLASGRLLTYDGDGHTAYGRHNDCVDSAVNHYLLEGQPPAQGLRCGS
ncbi:alpha/beta hydrolase [Kitasatospora kifunensis]|uniref:Pimeloyl-ACP methyl ester carboxylesterase n=1 Tax=Kitasatospora kifunensis TaxID=58351 RepID=A0A7W7R419_KITKI|nr:alpha/beta hydrolase [Kitasatospora kifunensis]MBB4924845.1 pimeloyl-ACP methyl ester carboxylesterase [Kitasatospora kifunensis]